MTTQILLKIKPILALKASPLQAFSGMNGNAHRLFKTLALAALIFGPLAAHPCSEFLSAPQAKADLTSYVAHEDYLGQPIAKNRWLLGRGTEGRIERVKKKDGSFVVEKTFEGSFESNLNFDLLRVLDELQIKSFKTFKSFEKKGSKHFYPWVKGLSLAKLLTHENIPSEVKSQLWEAYKTKLVSLVEELTAKRKDLFFQINLLFDLKEFQERVGDKENLEFIQLHRNGKPSKKESAEHQRFLIEMFDFYNQDDSEPEVLEPKPDNILVDPVTWEMHWIDPN